MSDATTEEKEIIYHNPKPVAVALMEIDTGDSGELKYLGIIRGNAPGHGGTAFPAGWVDEMENIETAVAREAEEECGIVSTPAEWQLLASKITPSNVVCVFAKLKRKIKMSEVNLSLAPNKEVLGFVCLDKNSEFVFNTHTEVAQTLFSM